MSPDSRRRTLIAASLIACVALTMQLPPTPAAVAPAPTGAPVAGPALSSPVAAVLSSPQRDEGADSQIGDLPHEAYFADRVMVRPADGADADAIAADLGGEVMRRPGRSGWVAMSVPQGTHIGATVEALRADDRVRQAGPMGVVRGAATGTTTSSPNYRTYQEYPQKMMGMSGAAASSAVKVAVIDSGVAYEDYIDGSVTYAQADTMSGVSFVNPYDFVNDDTHPNDDHMHGTHIASIIASEPQYTGDIVGVAPGVSIMPIKVLDDSNKGTELDLIDGLWHAVDNGADIINLSLAFDEDYVPSSAMQEVLQEAYADEIIVVAASGNDASDRLAWPAASPYVIGVAAACYDRTLADYSNTSPAVHVTGMGGCMDKDRNSDGYGDGMLAETIVPSDPSSTQYVLWGGTSQAAATVSGTAAMYLSSTKGRKSAVPSVLQSTALDLSTGDGSLRGIIDNWSIGGGAGIPRTASDTVLEAAADPDAYLVAVLPYLHRVDSDTAKPAAVIHVMESDGTLASGGHVWVSMTGSTAQKYKCAVTAGECHFIASSSVELEDADGAAEALGWAIEVAAYVDDDVNQIIEPGMFASDGLEVLVGALQDNTDTAGLPLGIYWPENATPTSSVTTSESYAFVDSGVGFASSPLGVLLSPGNFPSSALSTESVNLDGVGFSSSPLGTMNLTIIEFGGVGFASSPLGGVGFASSPLGLSTFKMAVMDGVGFASSPLGLDAFDIYAPGGSTIDLGGVGFSSSPLGGVGFASSPLNLAHGTSTATLTGTYIGDLVDDGGWTVGGGSFAAGTSLIGATMVDTTPAAVGAGYGKGYEICK